MKAMSSANVSKDRLTVYKGGQPYEDQRQGYM